MSLENLFELGAEQEGYYYSVVGTKIIEPCKHVGTLLQTSLRWLHVHQPLFRWIQLWPNDKVDLNPELRLLGKNEPPVVPPKK